MIPKQALPSLEEALTGTLFGNVKQSENQIVKLDPSELIEIEDQPFHPYSPEKLQELADDIKENGQISPCLVREKDGKKIILAGRNRKKACELAGVKVSCILIECDDPTANLILVNSNLNQRQELLPSEKAYAYRLQKESYEAKGQRKTAAAVAEQNSENVKMIQRYIKLTELTPALMNMVDSEQLPVMAGVEFSYLTKSDMNTVASYLLTRPELSISIAQAQQIRQLAPNIHYEALNYLFYPTITDETVQKNQTVKRGKGSDKPVTSVSIKISDLVGRGCAFDFDNATKTEIRDYILDSLESYFDQSFPE